MLGRERASKHVVLQDIQATKGATSQNRLHKTAPHQELASKVLMQSTMTSVLRPPARSAHDLETMQQKEPMQSIPSKAPACAADAVIIPCCMNAPRTIIVPFTATKTSASPESTMRVE